MKKTIIVGGGIMGLSAALAMHQRGFTVTLLDANSLTIDPSEISPRVYAINRASQRLFEQLGIWKSLNPTRISPYQHMHVWDASTHAHIDFDARTIATSHLGHIIDESNIRLALLNAIAQTDITLCPNNPVITVNETVNAIAVSTPETTISADLLMIADGASSSTRDLLQIPLTQWSYNQHALVTTVQTEKPHQQTAYQVFSPEGILAFLPLADAHQCSIVWSCRPQLTQHHMNQPEDVFNQLLSSAFEHHLGKTTVISQRYAFPLQMRHVKQYVGKRWMLMGDAAHTIHPLAGLGLNLGLADLSQWLMLIDKSPYSITSKQCLGAYQRHRKYAVWQMIALMEGLKTLFLTPFSPITLLRGIGLQLCNQLTPLKRLFIEHAAG